MAFDKKKRLLTVSYSSSLRNVPYKHHWYYVKFPHIRLSGRWLHHAGFFVDDVVEVEVKEDCLIIRKTNNSWKEFGKVERKMVDESGEPITR